MITSACLVLTLMSYDLHILETMMVELQLLYNYFVSHISTIMYISFRHRGSQRGARYLLHYAYILNFYKMLYPHRPALVAITISSLASTHV